MCDLCVHRAFQFCALFSSQGEHTGLLHSGVPPHLILNLFLTPPSQSPERAPPRAHPMVAGAIGQVTEVGLNRAGPCLSPAVSVGAVV